MGWGIVGWTNFENKRFFRFFIGFFAWGFAAPEDPQKRK
jgi:hypothetical protein